jgi:hypothetical protein
MKGGYTLLNNVNKRMFIIVLHHTNISGLLQRLMFIHQGIVDIYYH